MNGIFGAVAYALGENLNEQYSQKCRASVAALDILQLQALGEAVVGEFANRKMKLPQAKSEPTPEKTAELWELKRGFSKRLGEIVPSWPIMTLKVWKRDADKRLYVTPKGKRESYADYWHTGNNRQPPKAIDVVDLEDDAQARGKTPAEIKSELLTLFGEICSRFNETEWTTDQ
jgi:hypothetical protein